MTPVQGEQVDLYIFRGGGWVPFACAVSVSMSLKIDMIAVTTADSGTDEDYEPGFEDVSISLEGVTTFDDTSKFQMHEVLSGRRTKQQLRLQFTDGANIYTVICYALLESFESNNSIDDFSMWDITFRRCGAMTLDLNSAPAGGGGVGTGIIGSTFIVG